NGQPIETSQVPQVSPLRPGIFGEAEIEHVHPDARFLAICSSTSCRARSSACSTAIRAGSHDFPSASSSSSDAAASPSTATGGCQPITMVENGLGIKNPSHDFNFQARSGAA